MMFHATSAEPVETLYTNLKGGDLRCVVGRVEGQGGTLGVAGTPSRSRAVDVRYYILNEDSFTSAVRLRGSHAQNSNGFVKVSVLVGHVMCLCHRRLFVLSIFFFPDPSSTTTIRSPSSTTAAPAPPVPNL